MTLLRSLLLAGAAIVLAGCGDAPNEPDAARPALLAIGGAPGAVDKGDTVRLVATVRDQRGAAMATPGVAWSSLDGVPMRSAHVGSEGVNCGVATDGRPWCWGRNDAYQAGYSPMGEYPTPLPLDSDDRFGVFTVGFHDSCGLPVDGLPVCRGDINRVLTGVADAGSRPLRITDGPAFVQVAAMGSPAVVCGRTAGGEAWCWGWSDAAGAATRPTRVAGLPALRSMVGSYQGVCGLDTEGGAWC